MTAPICLDRRTSIRPFAVCQSHRQKHLSALTNGLNAMQLVLVSRNYHLDRDALAAALEKGGMGYLGMIGSKKKVLTVFDELSRRGVSRKALARVRAPIGINIGADSPAEIAVQRACRGNHGFARRRWASVVRISASKSTTRKICAVKEAPFAFGVVILAAGSSTRMGRCKLLLPWGDKDDPHPSSRSMAEAGAAQIAPVIDPSNQSLTRSSCTRRVLPLGLDRKLLATNGNV